GGITGVISGDCLAALGTLAGLQRAGLDPALVWFDAHGDVHTVASSASGYLGGMSLRMAMGGDHALLGATLGIAPIAEHRAVLVGARDLDPAEEVYLETAAVRRCRAEDLSERDLPAGPTMVHIDLDVIDASEVPGLRFPVAGGPSADQVLAALARLVDTGRVVALDIACPWFDPETDDVTRQRQALLSRLISLLAPAERPST
ncbi:MAG: arginase family protein, partial [Nocardioides sp.]